MENISIYVLFNNNRTQVIEEDTFKSGVHNSQRDITFHNRNVGFLENFGLESIQKISFIKVKNY